MRKEEGGVEESGRERFMEGRSGGGSFWLASWGVEWR